MKKPKISVIMWDVMFREYFHTVDFFANQLFPKTDYEFIWVEYYSNVHPELKAKISAASNARIICLKGEGQWRLAKCINEGISHSSGEVLVIPDGDVVVEPDFLETVWDAHTKAGNLVLYFRRWDEPKDAHRPDISLEHLEKTCEMRNPSNYSGCITMRRGCWQYVNGYEEHPVFAGPSFTGMELYTRLKNAGFPIMWHPTKKIYHPWHPNTGTPAQRIEEQSWLIKCRDLAVDYKASAEQVEIYLQDLYELRKVRQSGRARVRTLLSKIGILPLLRRARQALRVGL